MIIIISYLGAGGWKEWEALKEEYIQIFQAL
jgi:hypothetical protein